MPNICSTTLDVYSDIAMFTIKRTYSIIVFLAIFLPPPISAIDFMIQ